MIFCKVCIKTGAENGLRIEILFIGFISDALYSYFFSVKKYSDVVDEEDDC